MIEVLVPPPTSWGWGWSNSAWNAGIGPTAVWAGVQLHGWNSYFWIPVYLASSISRSPPVRTPCSRNRRPSQHPPCSRRRPAGSGCQRNRWPLRLRDWTLHHLGKDVQNMLIFHITTTCRSHNLHDLLYGHKARETMKQEIVKHTSGNNNK